MSSEVIIGGRPDDVRDPRAEIGAVQRLGEDRHLELGRVPRLFRTETSLPPSGAWRELAGAGGHGQAGALVEDLLGAGLAVDAEAELGRAGGERALLRRPGTVQVPSDMPMVRTLPAMRRAPAATSSSGP